MDIVQKQSKGANLVIVDDKIEILEIREGKYMGLALNDKQPETKTLPGFVFYDSRHAEEFANMVMRVAKIMADKEGRTI